jgi:prepilin-type N-terminal cleavage/methylation domain-containing protein
MLRRLQKLKEKQQGFTIIEVLIVLAIAGLIMVVVFLAIPNLQKSQRNNSRKTDANNLLSAFSDYLSNNGGSPYASNCTDATPCPFMSSWKPGYFTTPANVSYTYNASPAAFTAPTAPDSEHLDLITSATCATPAAAPTAGTSSRQVAVYYGIEGSTATQCVSE